MKSSTAYRPYPAQVKTEPTASIFSKPTETDKPLDILYIQAMDTEHDDRKKDARDTLVKSSKKNGINSGEISIKDLEGDSEAEKMESLTTLLSRLRFEEKLNDSTQVILSFKPGEDTKTLDISHGNFSGSWDAEEVLKAVTGKSTSVADKSGKTFNGTIHLFGLEPKEFKSGGSVKNNLQNYGNILVHTSGKLNWDYNHAPMIRQIVSSVKSVEGDDPEQRTKSMRNMLQPFAGYPIIRVSEKRITIKYPTFRDESNIKTYQNRIRHHKAPFDMLIYSIERDSFETFKKRMDSGLEFTYSSDLGKNKNFDRVRNSRLLTSLVLTSKDQKKKLDYLKTKGVMTDQMQYRETGSLQAAISKRQLKMDLELFNWLCEKSSNTKIRPINKHNILPFLKQRISVNGEMPESLDKSLELIGKNLKGLSGEDTKELIAYVLEISEKSDDIFNILTKLLEKGLDVKKLSESNCAELIDIVSRSVKNHDVSVLDFFYKNLFNPSKYLKDEVLISYKLFSKANHMWAEVEDQLKQKIKDNDSNFIEGLIDKIRFEMVNGQILANSPLWFLLQCGLDPNWRSDDNISLLGYFTQNDEINVDFIIHILNKGADRKVVLEANEYPLLTAIAANFAIDDEKTESIIKTLIDTKLVDIKYVFEGDFCALAGAASAFKHQLLKNLFEYLPMPIEEKLAEDILGCLLRSAAVDTKEDRFDSQAREKFIKTIKVFLDQYNKDDIFLDHELDKEFRKIEGWDGVSLIDFKYSISDKNLHITV